MPRLAAIAVLAVLAAGCRPATETGSERGANPTVEEATADTAVFLDATWAPDPDTPTFVTVTFDPRPGSVALDWSDASGEHTTEVDGSEGRVRILGLPAGSQVTWTLRVGDDVHGPETVWVPEAPEPLRRWVTTRHAAGEVDDRWILTTEFHFLERSFALVVDPEGRIRWWREAPDAHRILRVHPRDDGLGFVWASNIADNRSDDGRIVREAFDGTAPTTTVAPRLHHDFVEADGGYAYLAWVDRDMALVADGFTKPMSSDAVRLVDEGARGTTTDVFSFFDDWPGPVTQPCNHSRLLGSFLPGRVEWTHSNSLVRDPGGDGWWVMVRFLDQLVRIHADGTLGPVVGGVDPTLPFDGEGLPFAHGHMSQVTSEGHPLVFSNGDHVHELDGSYVVELEVDEADGVVREVGRIPEPMGRFVAYLGDARRLPGGHTLVVDPDVGLYEVAPDGSVVWEARHVPEDDIDYNLGRAELIDPLPPYGP